jgi:hypothetical protein
VRTKVLLDEDHRRNSGDGERAATGDDPGGIVHKRLPKPSAMHVDPIPPRRKLRWYQYSLRTLMLFTLVCAIALGYLKRKMNQAEAQRKAVAAIQESRVNNRNWYVLYEWSGSDPASYRLEHPPYWKPKWARNWLGDDFFFKVTCTAIRAELIDQVVHLPDLTALRIDGIDKELTDADLDHLIELHALDALNITGAKISDAGVKSIAKLRQFRLLNFIDCHQVTDQGLVHLRSQKQLHQLKCISNQLTDSSFEAIEYLPGLEDFALSSPGLTDQGVQSFCESKQAQRLKYLWLESKQFSNASVGQLCKLSNLKGLGLFGDLTDPCVDDLLKMPQLTFLILNDNAKLTDDGLARLAALPNLEVLSLHYTGLTDQGLLKLAGLPKIGSIEACGTKITPAGVKAVKALNPGLKWVSIDE